MRARTRVVLKAIGANVRALRLERHLTQAALAERADYDDRFIQYVEAGDRTLTIDSLVSLADALGVAPQILIEALPDSDGRSAGRRRVR